jgi:hypothetical protein
MGRIHEVIEVCSDILTVRNRRPLYAPPQSCFLQSRLINSCLKLTPRPFYSGIFRHEGSQPMLKSLKWFEGDLVEIAIINCQRK